MIVNWNRDKERKREWEGREKSTAQKEGKERDGPEGNSGSREINEEFKEKGNCQAVWRKKRKRKLTNRERTSLSGHEVNDFEKREMT